MLKKQGFIFIETIIVVCILTVGLMSLYSNYSKIIANTKELNTFDTTEYNYKTYFLKEKYLNSTLTGTNLLGANVTINSSSTKNTCYIVKSNFSEGNDPQVKVCLLSNVYTTSDYIDTYKSNFDAYIIDYLNAQDLNAHNDDLFLVEYKKEDKQNNEEYFTYISSLNY